MVLGIVALAMAPGARREIEASGGALDGATQLRAGTIMAWVTVGLTVLAVVAVVIGIAIAASAPEGSGALSSLNPAGSFDLRPSAG